MNLEKMTKKAKKEKAPVVAKEELVKKILISDTTYLGLGQASWESIYNFMEVEDPKEIEEETTRYGTDKLENTLKDLDYSYLHRIEARTKVLPYNDVVRWVIESINITYKTFFTIYVRMFGSFRVEDIKAMYHFLEQEKRYNKAFLEFAKENAIELDHIRKWRNFPTKHKHESFVMYSVDSLSSPYCYVGAMMCRLFGVHDSARFSIEMVPLMETVINGYIMDWETILSDKMANQILDYRKNRFVITWVIPPFYMSAYIMDIICFNYKYPILGWKWTL